MISKGIKKRASKVLIFGVEGIGKTTFASRFPKPLFIDIEDGTSTFDVARFEENPSSWAMLQQQIKYVYDNPESCKTLVIDSFDWAEKLCKEYISKNKGWTSISDPDYGKGYLELETVYGQFLNRLDEIINKGINVVGIAHAEVKTIQKPGEAGNYDKWQIKLEKKAAAIAKEWADAIIFMNYETFITNKKSGKGVISGGKRKMHLNARPEYEAKNRWNLQDDSYDLDYKIIEPFIYKDDDKEVKEVKEIQKEVKIDNEKFEEYKEEVPFKESEKNREKAKELKEELKKDDELEQVKPALRQLMLANDVTLDELMNAVSMRGYYPEGTEYKNLDPEFVDAVLIGAWDNGLFEFIKELREKDRIEF